MSGAQEQLSIAEHITKTPGVCGGKPCIARSRIRVQDIIVWHEDDGLSPAEILVHYPALTLADIYAALTYYHDHRDEIRQEMADAESFAEALKKVSPDSFLSHLNGSRDRDDAVSS